MLSKLFFLAAWKLGEGVGIPWPSTIMLVDDLPSGVCGSIVDDLLEPKGMQVGTRMVSMGICFVFGPRLEADFFLFGGSGLTERGVTFSLPLSKDMSPVNAVWLLPS